MHRDVKPHNVMIDHEHRKVRCDSLDQIFQSNSGILASLDRLGPCGVLSS